MGFKRTDIRATHYQTRPAVSSDLCRLADLHCRAFQIHVEASGAAWHEAQVRHRFRTRFIAKDNRVIVINGEAVGFVETYLRDERIVVRTIVVAKEFQNRGVGSAIIREIKRQSTRPIRLRVLKVSPACRFYERLGFVTVGSDEQLWWVMEWEPR